MAKDYQYYFAQLRRIEDHREAQAEKEIRKIYRQILKETRHFIADEYAALAEDGKLTYDILRAKGQDARFLQEVEQRLGDMSIDVSRQIKKTVEEMYQLSFDGLREAVEKSKDVEEFREIFGGMDRGKAQQLWATVDNTIMDIALEKNHKNIIWDIKREIATALTVGDRFDTMADRLAKSLDGNYKKATLIARTEVHRVREAAHSASAKELNETLKQGNSGLRYVKKWKTMKDGAVRPQTRYKTKKGWKTGKSRPGAPNHVKMHNVVVLEEEQFDLGGGVMTDAPGQSGVAGHDCNCRCQCLHLLMDDQEFFEATGRHFPELKDYPAAGVVEGQQKERLENSENDDTMTSGSAATENCDRIVVANSFDEELAAVNPNYATNEWKWKNNCQRCVPAYEMRRRGYDVTSKPIPVNSLTDDELASHFELAWSRQDTKWCMKGNGLDQIKEHMEGWGDGARAEVFVSFEGNGHVFFAEQIDGETCFYDPQNPKADASEYFKVAAKGKTRILRIDNNDPTDYILECCENRR